MANGRKFWFEIDSAFRVKSVSDNLGNVVTYTLDAAGNRVAEVTKDSSNNILLSVSRVMNSLNRVSQIKDSANNATTLAYNDNGDLISQAEPLSRTTSQTLDGLRRPTATTFADSSSTSQAWNARNEVTAVTDPKGVQTTYTRNAFGEVTSETSPDIGTVAYVRDALGAVIQRTDAKGNVTTITRDALGRPTTIQYGPANIVTYTWDTAPSGTPDQKGFLSKIEDPSGSTSYQRDIHGRVTKKTQVVNDNPSSPTTLVFGFDYWMEDLEYISYPSGMVIRYYPNGDGRLGYIHHFYGPWWGTNFAAWPSFSGIGNLQSMSFFNGATLARTFDADGRMTSNEFASYSYDADGRMTGITQSLAATTATSSIFNTSVSWTVGYDNRDRVTSFARAGAGSGYTYDANSNRLTSVESYSSDSDLDGTFTGTDTTLINAKSLDIGSTSNKLLGFTQVVTSTGAGSTTSVVTTPVNYSLDANGAMTSDGLRSFDYDESNRLAKVRILQSGEAAAVTYLTNGLGQRVFKSEPKAEQTLPEEETLGVDFIAWLKSKFRWMFEAAQSTASLGTSYGYAEGGLPSWALLGEYDNGGASGTGRTEYIWLPTPDGGAIPIGMRRNNRFYSIHADHLGTPRLVKDDNNQVVWQLPYSAFGNNRPVGVLSTTTTMGYAITPGATPLKATPPVERLNLRFPGQYADSETGELYNYFRNYDPRMGRYTQGDSIGLRGGLNRYGYVGANPLIFLDPFGLDKQFYGGVSGTLFLGFLGGGGGGNVGISTDGTLGGTSVFVQGQGNLMVGVGGFAGVGGIFGSSSTEGPITGGVSRAGYAEVDFGYGPAYSGGAAYDGAGGGISGAGPVKVTPGAGIGAALGIGLTQSRTWVSPSVGDILRIVKTKFGKTCPAN